MACRTTNLALCLHFEQRIAEFYLVTATTDGIPSHQPPDLAKGKIDSVFALSQASLHFTLWEH
jgi:hypothetical protein